MSNNKHGNALVDLIVGVMILGLVSISVVGAYNSLISMATNAFRNSQSSWFGNSVMEIYSAKTFDDITTNDSFTISQFSGYTANVTVEPKDVDLSNASIDDGDESSNYKQISVVISGPGAEEILTYTTLRSNCNQEGPILTSISTNWLSNQNSGPRFASSPNEVIIKLHFNRAVDIANPENIVLDLTVTQRAEGDDGYYDISEIPASTITVTGGALDANKQNLSFTYAVNPNHTSWTLTDYLDVSAITLNGATITGSIGGNSDGCISDISLPAEADSTLAANEVIIRVVPGVYYIFSDWGDLQDAINPSTPGSGLTAPEFADIFDSWKRFDGTNVYANKQAAENASNSRATAWVPQYIAADGNPSGTSQTQGNGYDTFDHFYMPLNVDPANGFVSPESYQTFTLEVTLQSSSGDDDMIGIIVAYAEGSNTCNGGSYGHDASTCATTGSTPYVLYAGRSAMGSEPREGWGLVYNKGNRVWYNSHSNEATNKDGGNGTGDRWNIREEKPPNSRTASQNWKSYYVRIKVERLLNNIKIYTTDFFNTRAAALNAGNNGVRSDGTGYFDGEDILEVDLEDDVRLHKFIGGSPFGYITFSQPQAKFLDNVIPEPEAEYEVETGYIVYFDERDDTNNDKTYVTWDPFDLASNDEAEERGINPPSAKRSGVWKWITDDWIFQEGVSIQDLNGFYGTISPNPDNNSDPPQENGVDVKYYIKKEAENQN